MIFRMEDKCSKRRKNANNTYTTVVHHRSELHMIGDAHREGLLFALVRYLAGDIEARRESELLAVWRPRISPASARANPCLWPIVSIFQLSLR